MTAVLTLHDVLPRLEKCQQVKPDEWEACCPAHEDNEPSLSIKEGDNGQLLLHCFAHCRFEDIIETLNQKTPSLYISGRQTTPVQNGRQSRQIVATYDYLDESGRLLYQKVRYEPKSFNVRRPNGDGGWIWNLKNITPVLYCLPDLLRPYPGQAVYIVEGEKDADGLSSQGLIATCNFDGASKSGKRSKWRPELYNRYLAGYVIYILPDNDKAGWAHAEYIASTLNGLVQHVAIIHLPGLGPKEDVTDWLNLGHTVEELEQICRLAPPWQPASRETAIVINSNEDDMQTAVTISANGYGRKTTVSMNTSEPVPPLPEAARVDPEVGTAVCPWLDDYTTFSQRMSPRGYDDFHEAVGLWVLSAVAARRLVVQLGTKAFFPNLYINLCAHTTLYAKTTTAQFGLDVLQRAGLGFLLLPNEATPAAFIHELTPNIRENFGKLSPDLQEQERQRLAFAAQRGWFYQEFGAVIRGMMREGGILSDFRGRLRALDDNPARYEYKTMTRHDLIEQPYLALLANMTPADIKPFAGPGAALWHDGFWARWAFVTPPINEPPKYGRFPNQPEQVPVELTEPLRQWHKSLGLPSVDITCKDKKKEDPNGQYVVNRGVLRLVTCTLGEGVLDAFYAYQDSLVAIAQEQAASGNPDLIGNYGRFAEKAIRVAMLLGSISNDNQLELSHWARAQTVTERWRANLHNLVAQVNAPAPSEERKREEQIIDVIRRYGPSTAAEIGRYIRGMSGPEVDDLCRRLVRSGILRAVETTNRGTNRYGISV